MKYVKHGTLNEYYFSFLERLCPGKNETIETVSEGTNDEFSSDEFSDDEFDNATYENLNGKLFQSPKDLKKREDTARICVSFFGCWLMNHVIYLKLRQK